MLPVDAVMARCCLIILMVSFVAVEVVSAQAVLTTINQQYLRVRGTGNCISFDPVNAAAGYPMRAQPCSFSTNQLISTNGGKNIYATVGKATWYVEAANRDSGSAILMNPFSTKKAASRLQTFDTLRSTDGVSVRFRLHGTTQCLNVNGDDETSILLWDCGDDQDNSNFVPTKLAVFTDQFVRARTDPTRCITYTPTAPGVTVDTCVYDNTQPMSNNGSTLHFSGFPTACIDGLQALDATIDTPFAITHTCAPTNNPAATQMWNTIQFDPTGVLLQLRDTDMCLGVGNGGLMALNGCTAGGDANVWEVGVAAAGGLPGRWSARVQFPVTPLSAANLPDGRVVLWSGDTPGQWVNDIRSKTDYVVASVADMNNHVARNLSVSSTDEMFCDGIAQMADGNLMVNGGSLLAGAIIISTLHTVGGGTTGASTMNTFTYTTPTNLIRGYNADTLLTDNRIFTVGGSFEGSPDATTFPNGEIGEVYDPGAKRWTLLPAVSGNAVGGVEEFSNGTNPDADGGIYRSDNHAWLVAFKARNGDAMVFHVGPVPCMHLINVSKGTMTACTNAWLRSDDAYSMNGNAVMYTPGKILKVGGAPGYGGAYNVYQATKAAYVVDITGLVAGTASAPITRAVGSMNFARTFGHAVVLPGGQVVVVGGQTETVLFSDSKGVLTAEIFDPTTNTFTPLTNPSTIPRTYHSIALLLIDATVLIAGGGAGWTDSEADGCRTPLECGPWVHFDGEILTPPYLLTPNPRPRIVSITTNLPASSFGPTIGSKSFTVVFESDDVDVTVAARCAFEIVRNAGVTHGTNNDQRRIGLSVLGSVGKGSMVKSFVATVAVPTASVQYLLDGYYYLFAVSVYGVPSLGVVVRVGVNGGL